LNFWPPGLWREHWFILSVSSAVAFWLGLWWLEPADAGSWSNANVVFYLSLVLWQPILEEFGFRGLLQGVLLDQAAPRFRIGPLTIANILASVAFGIAHLPSHPLLWVAGIFGVSLVLGYARDRSGSLYPAIALHSYFNAGYFLVVGLP
jgi:membrane protease YdiL (CAAX protease family)